METLHYGNIYDLFKILLFFVHYFEESNEQLNFLMVKTLLLGIVFLLHTTVLVDMLHTLYWLPLICANSPVPQLLFLGVIVNLVFKWKYCTEFHL